MTSQDYAGSAGRDQLSERDLAIATLVGRYIERREHQTAPCAHDLLAAAAEFGGDAADHLRTVLAVYEAFREDIAVDQRAHR